MDRILALESKKAASTIQRVPKAACVPEEVMERNAEHDDRTRRRCLRALRRSDQWVLGLNYGRVVHLASLQAMDADTGTQTTAYTYGAEKVSGTNGTAACGHYSYGDGAASSGVRPFHARAAGTGPPVPMRFAVRRAGSLCRHLATPAIRALVILIDLLLHDSFYFRPDSSSRHRVLV